MKGCIADSKILDQPRLQVLEGGKDVSIPREDFDVPSLKIDHRPEAVVFQLVEILGTFKRAQTDNGSDRKHFR
jgi:hypothetical protein